ncbi:MAG: polysaccharide deacetylase family protein [Chitinophagales bacterium]|nr:polysaccharide deacetylase family protein [Chitinophagales bacterium]
MKRFHWPLIVLLLGNTAMQAQFNQPWQGKKCAVVITYDDAIDQHLDNALPLLDSLGLKATFYVTAFSPSVQTRMEEWRGMAAKGHELGNHTLYHPCAGGPGREWVPKEYDLSTYTLKQIVDETRMTNLFLQALDGKTERTFAYTCGDQKVEDSFFIEPLKKDFIAARGVRGEMHKIQDIDLYNTDCYMVNHHKAEQMIAWVEEAMRTNSMLVILFHGVGGGNGLDVSLPDHRQFLQYLKDHEKDIYIAPMVDVAKHIRSWQTRDKAMKATQAQTQKDYKDMTGKLGITSTRPGPSGNPSAPNAANIDESKASPYTTLPDPLKLKNGKTVNNASAWWKKRRPEIVAAFDKEIYGRVPTNTPAVRWEIKSRRDSLFGGTLAEVKELVGHVDNSSYPALTVDIQFSLVLPKHIQQPVPVMIEFGFIFPPGFRPPAPPPGTPVQKSWQEQLLEKGWGFGILVPTSYQADNGAGLTEGIIGLCNKGQFRSPDQWGSLRAWAWGASRTIDYLETDPGVDAKRVGIEGLSRYGKAAIVTMAYEPRISIGFIGSSGAGGTKILRRVYGEQVENLASSAEYHWFAGNFIRYAGPLTPNDLPVDAHQLVALCAPRPVFISSGSPNVEGRWVDAKGMFLGGVHASPVYELLGKKGLGTDQFPEEKTGLLNGDIAWRQHEGGHTTGPNWEYFIQFAGRYW